ncbi:MAG: nucleotidyltransferase domain-containing protein [Patescibacteria group bacterium]|jgi:hypothetical protein
MKIIKSMRTKNEKSVKKYERRANYSAQIFCRMPYVRAVFLTGSLASGDANISSDIDMLVVTKMGRIFTARLFVILAATIMGIKRTKNPDKNHAGKVCLNYFLTENYLKIPHGRGEKIDKYCAENYSQAKFLAGDYQIFEKFFEVNRKLFKQYQITNIKLQINSRSQSHYPFYRTRLGNWFEEQLKAIQIRRIESDPITAKYPHLIVYNDQELRFHPPKFSKNNGTARK